ncbi:MAG: hypothetical protein GY913_35555 [Proteobacteria bacterium]|nr:hypothetical protein [Pseudomonadota bacterium]MCP4922249.1 hypothetical protein [Pseudomonadota bacterium]
MKCPDCGEHLDAALILETTDDDRPVYTDYQWWRCSGCSTPFWAVLVEDKTNIFNDDLDHRGYRPEPDQWERTRALAAACRPPRQKRCTCTVHQSPPKAYGGHAW